MALGADAACGLTVLACGLTVMASGSDAACGLTVLASGATAACGLTVLASGATAACGLTVLALEAAAVCELKGVGFLVGACGGDVGACGPTVVALGSDAACGLTRIGFLPTVLVALERTPPWSVPTEFGFIIGMGCIMPTLGSCARGDGSAGYADVLSEAQSAQQSQQHSTKEYFLHTSSASSVNVLGPVWSDDSWRASADAAEVDARTLPSNPP